MGRDIAKAWRAPLICGMRPRESDGSRIRTEREASVVAAPRTNKVRAEL